MHWCLTIFRTRFFLFVSQRRKMSQCCLLSSEKCLQWEMERTDISIGGDLLPLSSSLTSSRSLSACRKWGQVCINISCLHKHSKCWDLLKLTSVTLTYSASSAVSKRHHIQKIRFKRLLLLYVCFLWTHLWVSWPSSSRISAQTLRVRGTWRPESDAHTAPHLRAEEHFVYSDTSWSINTND